jgi:hypothetical protein
LEADALPTQLHRQVERLEAALVQQEDVNLTPIEKTRTARMVVPCRQPQVVQLRLKRARQLRRLLRLYRNGDDRQLRKNYET